MYYIVLLYTVFAFSLRFAVLAAHLHNPEPARPRCEPALCPTGNTWKIIDAFNDHNRKNTHIIKSYAYNIYHISTNIM